MSECEYSGEQGALEGDIEYLPIQEWFMKNPVKHRNHFNHSFLIRIDGKIVTERLKSALEELNRQHDMLRAVYRDGKQSYRKECDIAAIRELDISTKTKEEITAELTRWQSSFDIEKGYLWQSGIIRGHEDGNDRIYIAMHHLVTDVASWPILLDDLKELYKGKKTGKKGSSYRQWVEAVTDYSKNASEEEKSYWEEIGSELENQKGDWSDRAEKDADVLRYTRIELPEDVMKTLLQGDGPLCGTGVTDALLNALSYALYEVSGKKKNWIIVENQGREAIDKRVDVSRTTGWFTTLYPFCLTVDTDLKETIAVNKKSLGKVLHNGIGYGALYGYDKLPKILFNYLNKLVFTGADGWEIRLAEASGESMSPDNRYGNVVDINGFDADGTIRMGVESSLKEEYHDRLCEAFKRSIEAIATYSEGKTI